MSAAMEKGLPDELSEYNREGTCAHAVSECRLANWLDASRDPADEKTVDGYTEFFNPEFDEFVRQYVDWVQVKIQEVWAQYGVENTVVLLEQRLHFAQWVPEGFGTGDVVILVPGKVFVIDLKFGQGVYVDGEDNEQLKLYALGAWGTYNALYDFDEVEVWIHQPRKDNVSGETISVHDISGLLTWAQELIVPRAAIAWAAYNGDRREASFSPGTHCNTGFCKARFTCAARARYHLELADRPYALDEPDHLGVEEMEEITVRADPLARWAKDVSRYLLEQADLGKVKLVNFKIVEGRSNRVIMDEIAAAQKLMSNGYAAADIYKPPALSNLTALEAIVGKKHLVEVLGDLLYKPPGAKKLSPVNDVAPAVPPKRQSLEDTYA